MKRMMNTTLVLLVIAVLIGSLAMNIKLGLFHTKEEITANGVLEKIRPLSELNTVEMQFNEIIDYKDTKYFHDFEIPFTHKSFIFTAKARVKAGMNLMALTEDSIRINGTEIHLTLPAPVITSKEILEYKAYDEQDGLFNEITTEDTLKALSQFEESLEKQAIDSGILEQAQKNAKDSLTGLLKSLGFETISITFK